MKHILSRRAILRLRVTEASLSPSGLYGDVLTDRKTPRRKLTQYASFYVFCVLHVTSMTARLRAILSSQDDSRLITEVDLTSGV